MNLGAVDVGHVQQPVLTDCLAVGVSSLGLILGGTEIVGGVSILLQDLYRLFVSGG